MQIAIQILAIGVFAYTAQQDISTRHIPNEATLAICLLGVNGMIFSEHCAAAMLTLAAAAVVFAAAVLLWWKSVVGGGDVKLVAASALLLGYQDLCRFLLIMSCCGAVLAISLVVQLKPRLGSRKTPLWPRLTPGNANQRNEMRLNRPSVPYGVAIAAAASAILIF